MEAPTDIKAGKNDRTTTERPTTNQTLRAVVDNPISSRDLFQRDTLEFVWKEDAFGCGSLCGWTWSRSCGWSGISLESHIFVVVFVVVVVWYPCSRLSRGTLSLSLWSSLILFVSRLWTAENRSVGQKLAVATAFMVALPVATFYATHAYMVQVLDYKSFDADNWAGAAAIVMTNLIVGGYCYMAYWEDLEDQQQQQAAAATRHDNDASVPRVGIYKQRTD